MPRAVEKLRVQDPQVRRAQILDEAIGIIGARGYHAFVLQELAKRCGLTNGGLLYHFPSKEQLLLAVLEERDRRIAKELTETFGPGLRDAPLGQVLDVLRGMVEAVAAQPALARLYAILQAEALDKDHPAHTYFASRETTALEGFAALMAPHLPDPGATARQIHALMDGLTLQWLRNDQRFAIVAAWDQAVADLGWRRDKS